MADLVANWGVLMKKLILVLSMLGFASSALAEKVTVDCQNVGSDAGLESLRIVQERDFTLLAKVDVSGPGDAMETYTYRVKIVPQDPRRLGAPTVYAAKAGKFALRICTDCAPRPKTMGFHSQVNMVTPRSAKIYPAMKLSYQDLECTFNNVAQ